MRRSASLHPDPAWRDALEELTKFRSREFSSHRGATFLLEPPSSDGLGKKPVSLREPSGRPSGGQKGHKGKTLRQITEPDRIVTHEAAACRHCGSSLSLREARGLERRQMFDLPERLIEVTEHRGLVYSCAHCGGQTRAAFPTGVRGRPNTASASGPAPSISTRSS